MQHHNGNAKLNPQKVMEIRRLRAEGWSYPALARGFMVSPNTIQKICTGQSWQNVTQGQEILTDGEAQLRMLGAPPTLSQEEIAASMARLLKVQDSLTDEHAQSSDEDKNVPLQYQRGAESPEQYAQSVKEMIATAKERQARSGSQPTRSMATNAEKLLEALTDEHGQTHAHDAAATVPPASPE